MPVVETRDDVNFANKAHLTESGIWRLIGLVQICISTRESHIRIKRFSMDVLQLETPQVVCAPEIAISNFSGVFRMVTWWNALLAPVLGVELRRARLCCYLSNDGQDLTAWKTT